MLNVSFYKMNEANKNGYTVIRIIQEDVFFDKNDWKNKLVKVIKKYDKPENVYIYIKNQ